MARVLPFVMLLLSATALRAAALAPAQIARALLGPDIWSRVLYIENASGTARYPAQLHALVFELEERLWLYTEFDGTQSLSLYAGRLEQDKTNLAPLLREILPELRRFTDVTDALAVSRPLSQVRDTESLPGGCFIKCIARLRALQREASPPDEAGLLAYYVETQSGRVGHCVLVYRQDGQRYAYDPEGKGTLSLVPRTVSAEPLALARAVYPVGLSQPPTQARLLALRQPVIDRDLVLTAGVPESEPSIELPASTTLY